MIQKMIIEVRMIMDVRKKGIRCKKNFGPSTINDWENARISIKLLNFFNNVTL